MVFIWSGLGILSIVVFFVVFIGSINLLPDHLQSYCFPFAALIAGIFSWYFGNRWNNKTEKILLNKEEGKIIVQTKRHSLFWIKMEYWGIIFPLIAIIVLAQTSLLYSGILTIVLLFMVCLLLLQRQKNLKIKEQEETEQKRLEEERLIAEEEEKIIRRKEKEDPRRFMPQ